MSSVDNRSAKLEFVVDINDQQKVEQLRNLLTKNEGINVIDINLDTKRLLVETTLQSTKIQNLIENSLNTGAVLLGSGGERSLGAAVSAISSSTNTNKDQPVHGLVRFIQIDENSCIIEGTIGGLNPGQEHGINIHEYGDISNGCDSCGDHYNPFGKRHGSPSAEERHVGDLGNIRADEHGEANFRLLDRLVKVSDIIGRSFVVHARKDDCGKNDDNPLSKLTGNSEPRLACGIVARSAGIFENTKRLCTCSGATIWQERQIAKAKHM